MKPSECCCEADILSLDCSHKSLGDFDMLVRHDGAVHFVEQAIGETPKQSITIPRRKFQAMLRWYYEEQGKDARTENPKSERPLMGLV